MRTIGIPMVFFVIGIILFYFYLYFVSVMRKRIPAAILLSGNRDPFPLNNSSLLINRHLLLVKTIQDRSKLTAGCFPLRQQHRLVIFYRSGD